MQALKNLVQASTWFAKHALVLEARQDLGLFKNLSPMRLLGANRNIPHLSVWIVFNFENLMRCVMLNFD